MSSSELDLTVAPSAEQIRKREFATVRRGYDADQVRDYLTQVAAQIEALEHQAHEAKTALAAAEAGATDARTSLQVALERARMAEAEARAAKEAADAAPTAPPEDPYAAFGERMAEMMRTAEKEAQDIRDAAEMESRRLEMEARAEADRITTDAQARAEELRSGAEQVMDRSQEEADRMLAGLYSKKEALKAELEHMRERLMAMAESLESLAGPGPASVELESGEPAPEDRAGDPFADATEVEKEPRFFSESQLKELWEDDEALLPEDADLIEQIDETMADAEGAPAPSTPPADPAPTPPPVFDATTPIPSSPVASEPVAPENVDPPAASPFFVDETTPPEEDPGPSGLYPR